MMRQGALEDIAVIVPGKALSPYQEYIRPPQKLFCFLSKEGKALFIVSLFIISNFVSYSRNMVLYKV